MGIGDRMFGALLLSPGGILMTAVGALFGKKISSYLGLSGTSDLDQPDSGGDPVQPDTKDPGQPELSRFEINTAEEGGIIPDLLGISKITGNIVHYEGNRSAAIKETRQVYAGTRPVVTSSGSSSGGKGGGGTSTETTTVVHEPVYQTEEVTVGYAYYLTWYIGICMGPVDTLYAVYRGDEAVWSGEVARPVAGYQDIAISGMGTMRFYFGDTAQPATDYAPKRVCYAAFLDCYIGAYNRCPVMRFVLGKRPTKDFNANETVNVYEYNPAHAIWHVLHDMVGLPESYLSETAFSDAADTLLAEGFGVSVLFDSQQSAQTWLESLLKHVDGVVTWKGQN